MYKGQSLFESDVNPVFRCLADNYLGADTPKLQQAFFDIEDSGGVFMILYFGVRADIQNMGFLHQ